MLEFERLSDSRCSITSLTSQIACVELNSICQFYTYNPDALLCLMFSDCSYFSDQFCQNCVSGEPTCILEIYQWESLIEEKENPRVFPCLTTADPSAVPIVPAEMETGRKAQRSSRPSGLTPFSTCWRKCSSGWMHFWKMTGRVKVVGEELPCQPQLSFSFGGETIPWILGPPPVSPFL